MTCIVVFFYRSKQNWGNQYFYPSHAHDDSDQLILKSFIMQFYDNKEPPEEIVLNIEPENLNLIQRQPDIIKLEEELDFNIVNPNEKFISFEKAFFTSFHFFLFSKHFFSKC
mgnify:CR=1 FL=1